MLVQFFEQESNLLGLQHWLTTTDDDERIHRHEFLDAPYDLFRSTVMDLVRYVVHLLAVVHSCLVLVEEDSMRRITPLAGKVTRSKTNEGAKPSCLRTFTLPGRSEDLVD